MRRLLDVFFAGLNVWSLNYALVSGYPWLAALCGLGLACLAASCLIEDYLERLRLEAAEARAAALQTHATGLELALEEIGAVADGRDVLESDGDCLYRAVALARAALDSTAGEAREEANQP